MHAGAHGVGVGQISKSKLPPPEARGRGKVATSRKPGSLEGRGGVADGGE